MFAATHFDNLLVLLFFAIAILFQILTSAAAKSRKRRGDTERRSTSPSQMSRPLTTQEDERDEARIRKFLEALGQPTTTKALPPVAPRPTYQRPIIVEREESIPKRRPTVFSPLPPLTTQPLVHGARAVDVVVEIALMVAATVLTPLASETFA